jgi:hypothetical protein
MKRQALIALATVPPIGLYARGTLDRREDG